MTGGHKTEAIREGVMPSTILALHPDPLKQGTSIDKEKYDQIRAAILKILSKDDVVRFKDLPAAVESSLDSPFNGSISWYVTTVKLDLEARHLIERIPNTRPQQLRLVHT